MSETIPSSATDLQTAHDGAVQIVSSICAAAQCIGGVCGRDADADITRNLLSTIKRLHEPTRKAVERVANRLAKAREQRGVARI